MYVICNQKDLDWNIITATQHCSQDPKSAVKDRKWIEEINSENKDVIMWEWCLYPSKIKTDSI